MSSPSLTPGRLLRSLHASLQAVPKRRVPGTQCLIFGAALSALSGCAGEVSDADNNERPPDTAVDAGVVVVSPSASSTENQTSSTDDVGTAMNDDDTSLGGDTSVGPEPVEPVSEDCVAEAAVGPLFKLSTVQYRNTIGDILTALNVAELNALVEPNLQAIPDDSRSQLFRGLDARISLEHVEGYFNVARTIADAITQNDAHIMAAVGDCVLASPPAESCLTAFVERIGLLAYRRPLTVVERDELWSAASEAAAASTTGAAAVREQVRAVIIAALVSPQFVNHVEVEGTPVAGSNDLLQLSSYEIASRLAYTFWQSMPDGPLMDAAADGRLLTQAGRRGELDRIMASPRTRETLWNFWREWLALENFTGFELGRPAFQALARDTGVDEQTYDEMVGEIRELTEHFTFDAPSTLNGLLGTNASVTRSETLAALYGVSPWSGQGDFPTFAPGERAGLFQRAALLVSSLEETNPFHRGAFYRRYLLCEALPSPDPAALPPGSLDIPAASTVETTRQRFDRKIAGNQLCTGCHGLFTETGYALESFDSLGRFRTIEQVFDPESGQLLAELQVDSTATVRIGNTSELVHSPAELNALTIAAGDVEACLAEQYFRFAARRVPDPTSSDGCVTQELARAASDDERGLLGAFRHIGIEETFYHRKVGAQ